MPRQKRLTDKECHEKLNKAVDSVIDAKLKDFRVHVCDPRISQTNAISKDITDLRAGQEKILHRLDNVSANGNPGLENSLKDLYTKTEAVHTDVKELVGTVNGLLRTTESTRRWQRLFDAWRDVLNGSVFVGALKSKVGRLGFFLVLLILANTILHAFDIKLDIASIITSLVKP